MNTQNPPSASSPDSNDIRYPYKFPIERYPVHLSLNFIDLYETEIIERLTCGVGQWKLFEPVLDAETIQTAISDDYNKAESFYQKLRNSDKNALFYRCLVRFFVKVDTDLCRSINTNVWTIECKEMFYKVLNIIHKLRPLTDVVGTLNFITTVSFELKRNYLPVIERLASGEITEDYAKSLMFRTMPLLSDANCYHMFFGIWVTNQESHPFIDEIMPEFDVFYQLNYADIGAGVVHCVGHLENSEKAIETIFASPGNNEFARDLFYDRLSEHLIMPLYQKTTKDRPLQMRSYQMELANKAIQDENVVVVAPTGSGKTIIATYIIRQHLFEFKRLTKKPKIAFVVPSTPLVSQQCDVFKQYLSSMARIVGINGGGTVGIAELIHSYDIFVVTPMIIVNALNPDTLLETEHLPFTMGDLTLIILDEVHHANKLHPYNELMNEYRKYKYGDDVGAIRYAPKVIGFTASIGAPQKIESVQQVMSHIVKICANIDATNVIRVERHTDELEKFTPQTNDEVVVIPDSNEPVFAQMSALATLLQRIESYIRGLPGVAESLFEGYVDISMDFNKYVAWLSKLDERLPQLGLQTTISWKARMATTYLQRMVLAYQGFSSFPSNAVISRFLAGLGNEDNSDLGLIVRREGNIIQTLTPGVPKVFNKLVELMNSQFEKEPNSRIMVFVQQREYCLLGKPLLKDVMKREVAYLTGVNSSRDLGGMSLSDQQEQLQLFNSGKAPIMLATSVADEGVDVGRCNLVIKFDDVSNDIAHVQRRGRARQMESRCVLITPHDYKHVAEIRNADKTGWVDRALTVFEALIPNARKKMFTDAIIDANLARIEEAQRLLLVKEVLAPASSNYTLHCKQCARVIVDSKFVRVVTTSYTVCDEFFWSKVYCRPVSSVQDEKYSRVLNDVICYIFCNGKTDHGPCSKKLGLVINLKGIPFPLLSCKDIFFENKTNSTNRVVKKKWKDVLADLFYPPQLTTQEMLKMANAPEQPEVTSEEKAKLFEDISFEPETNSP